MPQITIKAKHIQKLKELNIFDQWLSNVKLQWMDERKVELQKDGAWKWFIGHSFTWSNTSEGGHFWGDIAKK